MIERYQRDTRSRPYVTALSFICQKQRPTEKCVEAPHLTRDKNSPEGAQPVRGSVSISAMIFALLFTSLIMFAGGEAHDKRLPSRNVERKK